jgi:tripartite ATP-independent transporter DctM subunit
MIIFLLFVILIFLGVPIGMALLAPAVITFIFNPEIAINIMDTRLATSYLSSSLLAIPLFIFAAQILTDIEIADAIFNFVNKCVGHIRGGLAHVNVLASVIFAGMSGSATADVAGLGKVEIEAMNKQGYPPAFSAAVTVASSAIGPIVPPSVVAIVYGSMTGVSVGKLLIGGFIPGLLMASILMVQITLMARKRGFLKTKFAGFRELWKIACKAIPGLMAPVVLIGGMLFGIFTPTEAAAVAVVYAIVIGFCFKTLNFKQLWEAFKKSALDCSSMMFIFLGANLIGLLVIRMHIADAFINFISGCSVNPVVFLMVLNILLLIAGCLLDPMVIIILFAPILAPVVRSLGIDPVHFGVMMILNVAIGPLTPPMGNSLFIVCKTAEIKLVELLKEIWPFIIGLIIALLIITYVPQTVTWLPSLFIK